MKNPHKVNSKKIFKEPQIVFINWLLYSNGHENVSDCKCPYLMQINSHNCIKGFGIKEAIFRSNAILRNLELYLYCIQHKSKPIQKN